MKSVKLKILTLFLTGLALAQPIRAQVNYSISGNTAYVDSSPNASGDIVIASTYNGYAVTSIGGQAFHNCYGLTSITIPVGVTSVGDQAFFFCTGLTNITIPESVTNIGFGAFSLCQSLTSVTIPNSVTSLGSQAFINCSGLTNVNVPNSLTSIGDYVFDGCGLEGISIPNSVTSIGGYAFASSGLTSITIPGSVTSIGDSAFEYCYGLTNLTFLGNAPTLSGNPFYFVSDGTVYYYAGTIGWDATYGGLPTVMHTPAPQIRGGASVQSDGSFGFTISGVTNQTIVVEASTNLVNWEPIWTYTLSGTNAPFRDSQWATYPKRFYRAR